MGSIFQNKNERLPGDVNAGKDFRNPKGREMAIVVSVAGETFRPLVGHGQASKEQLARGGQVNIEWFHNFLNDLEFNYSVTFYYGGKAVNREQTKQRKNTDTMILRSLPIRKASSAMLDRMLQAFQPCWMVD